MKFFLLVSSNKISSILFIISIIVIYCFQSPIKAQSHGSLRGLVTDSLSGERLPFANVIITEPNIATSVDSKGYFYFSSLPTGIVELKISYIGYVSKIFQVRIEPNKILDVHFQLAAKGIEMQTIETIADADINEIKPDLSLQKIRIKTLENIPKGVELDIFRYLSSLAGVQTGGDISARFYVRGSASNENLVLLDNTPIYNPFHALGLFSAIEPDMINSIEFYKGGFPSDFSNRLSSVIKVNTKNGNKNSFGGKASLSLLTAKLLFEGPIPNGSFIISGRKNYSNEILKKYRDNNSIPADFYDLFTKINFTVGKDLYDPKYSISAFVSNDKITNNNPNIEDYKWDNALINFSYFTITNSPLSYQVDLSYSSFNGEKIPNYSNAKGIINKLSDFNIQMGFEYIYDNKNVLVGGLKISEVRTSLLIENINHQKSNSDAKGTNISAFAKFKLLSMQNFGTELGLRLHGTRYAGGGSSFFAEPRLGFNYKIIPEITFKGNCGIFMQDIVTISDENEAMMVFEPWIITPDKLKPSEAIHFIGGLQLNPTSTLSMNIEAYYKILKNIAIVNNSKFFETDPDLISGSGKAYGLEFTTNYSLHPFTFVGSYSLMWTYRTVNNITYHPRYDSRHNLNLSLGIDIGAGWNFSTNWSFNTGLPFTQVNGYFGKYSMNYSFPNLLDFNSYMLAEILGATNAERLPNYHRLDLNLSKKFQIGQYKFLVDLSVLNAYDRKNLFYYRRDNGERVDMLPFLPSINIKVEL